MQLKLVNAEGLERISYSMKQKWNSKSSFRRKSLEAGIELRICGKADAVLFVSGGAGGDLYL